ncbi:MAG: polysaccharide deacetylase family protein, partial [Myxococcales bacterium]|nr:polysaccharide deacetylase family protein [Myxococcales bacterium]
DAVAEFLWRARLTRPRRKDVLTVATFHRVLPAAARSEYPYPELVVTPEALDFFLRFFRKHYDLTTLSRGWQVLREGRASKPLLCVTFDDGQRDNDEHARPVLEANDCHATFFIATDATEQNAMLWHDRVGFAVGALRRRNPTLYARELPDGLAASLERAKTWPAERREAWVASIEEAAGGATRPSWDGMIDFARLRAMHAAGHEIGSHSCSHPTLPTCDDARLARELDGSRQRLRAEGLGEVTTLCYPNGDHDARVRAAAARAGYTLAVSTDWGLNRRDADPFALRRCDVQIDTALSRFGGLSAARLGLRLSGLQPGLTGRAASYAP